MSENRHLRFADIDGLTLADLPVAAEIWLADLCTQPWASREIVKLANHFKRYLDKPQARMMALAQIETDCHCDKQNIVEALRQMYAYGTITGYAVENNIIRVSINLTLLQRLRVLETCKRWAELRAFSGRERSMPAAPRSDFWLNEPVETGLDPEPAPTN